LSRELRSKALFYSARFATLILDELRKLPILAADAKTDIATVVKRIGAKAEVLVAALFERRSAEIIRALVRPPHDLRYL